MEKLAILPAYNLENSIAGIVERTKDFVDLVVVVADGSKDKTWERARAAGAICVPFTTARGKGRALRAGIEYSRHFNPKYVILMDSDGQHLPEEIPGFMEAVKDADMVVGSRMKGVLKTSTINKIGNFFLKAISYVMTGKWFSDTESGFRAFKAEKLYSLNLTSNFYEIESELLLKALKKGFKIAEVPITVPKAVPGVTVLDGVKMGLYKIRVGLLLKLPGAE